MLADPVRLAASLFQRGLTNGSSGNLSMRVEGGFLVTPTNSCLGFLDPARLSLLDDTGQHRAGDAPTKELPLHLTIYKMRPSAKAIVHLHSTYATLLSCRAAIDPKDALPPLTPYVVMRVGQVALVPYTRPGDAAIIPFLEALSPHHAALLLANHGPVVAGSSLENALFTLEELFNARRCG